MFGIAVSAERAVPSQGSPDEQAIWNLERAYWRYVENNDLTAYAHYGTKIFSVGRR